MIRNDNISLLQYMGGNDKQDPKEHNHRPPQAQPNQESQEESNQTMPIHIMERLFINERRMSVQTSLNQANQNEEYRFLKHKPIKKRLRKSEVESRQRLKEIHRLSRRVEELQQKLRQYRRAEDSCPHCHFYLQKPNIRQQEVTPGQEGDIVPNCFQRSSSKDSLEFEKIDLHAPLMYSTEMQEKSWIFLGTVLIAMGSKVMDTDGTLNVFKIVKQSVDQIRRQVQKSQEKLSLSFFMAKEELEPDSGMNELDFDPFYRQQQNPGGLQLESVRVESVQEYELCFDQKLVFNVKYDALITAMEYMKEHCSLTFN